MGIVRSLAVGACALLLGAGASGCTATSPPSVDPSVVPAAAALSLENPPEVPESTCFSIDGPRDLAVFDIPIRTSTALRITDITLLDPVHVTTRFADALALPPINYGGRINFTGSATWPLPPHLLATQTSWPDREKLLFHEFSAGETTLPVIHVRRTGLPAGFGGYVFHYTTDTGASGTVEYRLNYAFKAHCTARAKG